MIDELIKLDTSFLESKFKTDIDNVFVQLHLAVMKNNLQKIKHFVNDEVYSKYEVILNKLNNNKEIQMYDEINVKDTIINSVEILNGKYVIIATITSRYMDYILDKNSGTFKRGNNTSRIEKTNQMVFEKRRDAMKQDVARKCASCGAPIDVNASGKCNYCGSIYELSKYDWILTKIETF